MQTQVIGSPIATRCESRVVRKGRCAAHLADLKAQKVANETAAAKHRDQPFLGLDSWRTARGQAKPKLVVMRKRHVADTAAMQRITDRRAA